MTGTTPPGPGRQNVIPMLRRIGEVVKTILGLAESVEELKTKNDELTGKVDELRRDLDQQAGQIGVLLDFVQRALDDRVDRRAEAAARRVLSEYEAKAVGKPPSERDM